METTLERGYFVVSEALREVHEADRNGQTSIIFHVGKDWEGEALGHIFSVLRGFGIRHAITGNTAPGYYLLMWNKR